MNVARLLLASLIAITFCQCSTRPKQWNYKYEQGKTGIIIEGAAVPPANLPKPVLQAVEAGNHLKTKPYIYGGGHSKFEDNGYDCSGCVSYVLHAAGYLKEPTTSGELRSFGQKGEGKHITVYAKDGHAFIIVAGLRLDTGYHGGDGPRWTQKSRTIRGYKARHPEGL
jgi:hypothetical protein